MHFLDGLILRKEEIDPRYIKLVHQKISYEHAQTYLFGWIKIGPDRVLISKRIAKKLQRWSPSPQTLIGSESISFDRSGPSAIKINEIPNIPEYIQNTRNSGVAKFQKRRNLSLTVITPYEARDGVGWFTGEFNRRCDIHIHKINKYTSLEIILNRNVGDSHQTKWPKYISKDRNIYEQNIEIIYNGGRTFWLIACLRILPRQKFLAWFPFQQWLDYVHTPEDCFQCPGDVPLRTKPQLTLLKQSEISKTLSTRQLEIVENAIQLTDETVLESIQCFMCSSSLSSSAYLARPTTSSPCVDALRGREFECKFFEIRFGKGEILRVHIRQVHNETKPYKCPICNKSFSQSISLSKHFLRHTDDCPFQYDICPQRFRALSMLATYLRKDTEEKPFKCPTCEQTFYSHLALHGHIRRLHKTEPPSRRNRRRPPG
ncbi:PR domain zinc finger protein 14 [Thelohanellus kitauei]|uniref:PR domain zinc finger protein 14 n=1 Tax=Thelohanellus kitauei TaxID=669202 RepID=A0A0C2IUL6_THEKT|nr:PR domain zinc finger protein 14 [Thelohanellus kitauei]